MSFVQEPLCVSN